MFKNHPKLDTAFIEYKTEMQKHEIEMVLKLADEFINDPLRKDRLNAQECKPCFYESRLAGNSATATKCACCEKKMYFGSTDVDILCIDCAKKLDLCKHCGGDIESKHRRKHRSLNKCKGKNDIY